MFGRHVNDGRSIVGEYGFMDDMGSLVGSAFSLTGRRGR